MKIGAKIFLGALSVPIVLLILGSSIFYPIAYENTQNEIFAHLKTAAKDKANWLNSYLRERKYSVEVLSAIPVVVDDLMEIEDAHESSGLGIASFLRTGDYAMIVKRMDSHLKKYKDLYGYDDILVLDDDGNIVYTAMNNKDLGTNIHYGPYRDTSLGKAVVSALETGKPAFSDYEYYAPTGEIAGFIANIIYNEKGAFHGVIVVELPIDRINAIMEDRTGLGKTGETYLVGKDLLMRSNSRFLKDNVILKQKVRTDNAIAGFRDKEKSREYIQAQKPIICQDYRGVSVLGVNEYIPELGWVLLAEIDQSEAFASLKRLRAVFMTIAAAIATLAFLSSIFISRNITRPIKALHDGADRIKDGDLDHSVATRAKDEVGDLSRAFDAMTNSIKESREKLIRYEKMAALGELASMVGHELKNPLNTMKTIVYLLKQKLTPSVADQETIKNLDMLGGQVDYSYTIIDDILKYGRIKRPKVSKNRVEDILEEVIGRVDIPANVKMVKKGLETLPEVLVDKNQIALVFTNIILNAIQAMPQGGKLEIEASNGETCGNIDFVDTGVGIPEEDLGKIFELFFTSKEKGTGVGLPICQSIILAHGGTISVESEEGKGTRFIISLPYTSDKC